jgi:biotin carboxyl carrier protein
MTSYRQALSLVLWKALQIMSRYLHCQQTIDTLSVLFSANNAIIPSGFFILPYKNLGELQQAYQTFSHAFIDFKNYLHGGFYEKKKQILGNDLSDIKRLNAHLAERKVSQQQDVALAQKTFEMNEILKKEKVISDLEYRNEKSKLLMKQMSIPQINEAIIANETQQNEKRKEIMELDNTIAQQASVFQQAINTFKSEIDEWKKKYLLVSPVSGKISFVGFLQENQQLKAGQTVCFINPGNSKYFAETFIPQENFGKVKRGEKVLLKFSSYPSQEFGSVTGELDFISAVPTDSGYIAKIVLPNGLKTNYNKQVQYREGLTASADIITKNMRLIERFYYNLRKDVQR